MLNELAHVRPESHFRLRRVGPAEHPAVLKFAIDCQEASTPPRPLHELLKQANQRESTLDLEGVYVVEDVTDEVPVMVGAAASICHLERFIEICGATVRRQGYDLQRVLTIARTFDVDVRTSQMQFFCIVPRDKPKLRTRMCNLGFQAWDAPEGALVGALQCPLDAYEYLLLSEEALRHHDQQILKLSTEKRLLHRKLEPNYIVVDLDLITFACPHFRHARANAAP